MKVVNKTIDVVAWFDKKGHVHPVRFRYAADDESVYTIKVGKVITTDKEKQAGVESLVFNCQSVIGNSITPYQIKYEKNNMKWILFKI